MLITPLKQLNPSVKFLLFMQYHFYSTLEEVEEIQSSYRGTFNKVTKSQILVAPAPLDQFSKLTNDKSVVPTGTNAAIAIDYKQSSSAQPPLR